MKEARQLEVDENRKKLQEEKDRQAAEIAKIKETIFQMGKEEDERKQTQAKQNGDVNRLEEAENELNTSQDSELERAFQYEIMPFKYVNLVNFSRGNAQDIFKEYNDKGELNQFPDEIEPKDNAVYVFEASKKEMTRTEAERLVQTKIDAKNWYSETYGGANAGNVKIRRFKHVSKSEDGKRDRSRVRIICHDTNTDQYLVYYGNFPNLTTKPTKSIVTEEASQEVEKTNPSVKALPHLILNRPLEYGKTDEVEQIYKEATENAVATDQNEGKFIESPKAGELYIFKIGHYGKEWPKVLGTDSYRWKKTNYICRMKDGEITRQRSNVYT